MHQLCGTWHGAYPGKCKEKFQTAQALRHQFSLAGNAYQHFAVYVYLCKIQVAEAFFAGISYEFIRLAGRKDNGFVNLLSKPGLMLQKITTREPEDSMIEVGIASVEAVFDWRNFLKENF